MTLTLMQHEDFFSDIKQNAIYLGSSNESISLMRLLTGLTECALLH